MLHLNRCAILIRAKQPYVDWILGLPGPPVPVTLEELRAEPTIYLVDPDVTASMYEETVRGLSVRILEVELMGWDGQEESWPSPRTWELFQEWFDWEMTQGVVDVVGEDFEGIDPEELR